MTICKILTILKKLCKNNQDMYRLFSSLEIYNITHIKKINIALTFLSCITQSQSFQQNINYYKINTKQQQQKKKKVLSILNVFP